MTENGRLTPTERLVAALDPRSEIDLGLAVTIAHDLSDDAATVLAELVDKRVRRAVARTEPDHDAGTVVVP